MARWRPSPIGDLRHLVVLVTGATSGIGREAARTLAHHGALVVLGARDPGRAQVAVADIARGSPGARLEVQQMDLADLATVHAAAEDVAGRHDHLDVLVNNAGVMAVPYRQTVDGFELQMGTNHLGHHALTGLLWPLLVAAPRPRVVTVTSMAHRVGRVDLDDLQSARGYDRWRAYGQSKLANLLFTVELQRRADAAGVPLVAAACHPGYAATHLQQRGPRMEGRRVVSVLAGVGNAVLAQSAAAGSEPTVAAAVDPDVRGGDVIGPRGPGQARGRPTKVGVSSAARDADVARRLWEASEAVTGVAFP